jgi:flagellar hook-basal body complex protein FliE
MIIDTHDLLSRNNASSSETTKSTSETTSEMTNQKKLNDISDEFEILLNEAVSNINDLQKFDLIKEKLRQLFVHLEKRIDE